MCVVFEWGWWYVLFTYREPNNPGPGFIFFIINPLVIIAVVLYIEGLNIESPLKTSSIVAGICGFFHGFGIWMSFCQSEGPIRGDNVILAIFFSSIVGAIVAVPYCVLNFILHFPWRLCKEARKELREAKNWDE
jgi:hypothetical protein